MATPHLDFIVAAYAAAVVIVGLLIGWVVVDYRGQRRRLTELERQGITRRSAPRPGAPMEQVKEQA